ncbi:hypothetical protein [Pseudovibrio sp. SPO723]|uniref:GntP family permease n=1 Tax=Nesiotobacter zosterae TaxID=392721 RepID=UPI0029C3252F|nr:hypothetical protein [Pseudovibrio sp. SPO723]MDX5595286.1 hypothetical protein [Pseudovibrio sp. SPO723]
MLGVIGIIGALALLIFLAYKGWGMMPATALCSVIVILSNGGDVWTVITGDYIEGLKVFIGSYFVLFALGAIFGQFMGDSGAAEAIAYKITTTFGTKHAILVVILASALLTYGGVLIFVVVFAIFPIAKTLYFRARLPKRLILGALGLGTCTFTMTALPGSPSLLNIIPAQTIDSTPMSAPILGILCSLAMFGMGYFYLQREGTKALQAAEFNPSHDYPELLGVENQQDPDASALPNWMISVLPIFVIIGSIVAFSGDIDTVKLVCVALGGGILVIFATSWKYLENPVQSFNAGAQNSVLALLNTSSVVAFGFVVKSMPAFQSFVDFAMGLDFGIYTSIALASNIIAGIVGSSSGGLTIFMQGMGQEFIARGADPDIFHRIAAIAAGGLDSLPHSGAVITMLMVMGLTHKEAYKDFGVVTVVIPMFVTACAVVFLTLLYG